jgi:hypothetical protein
MKNFFFIIIAFAFQFKAYSQDYFQFEFSEETFVPIQNGNIIFQNLEYTGSFGQVFDFPFLGHNLNYDSLSISFGDMELSNNQNEDWLFLFIMAFENWDYLFETDSVSEVIVQTGGSAPNRMMKVEFSHLIVEGFPGEYISFQYSFFEEGKVEIHFGPKNVSPNNPTMGPGRIIIGDYNVNTEEDKFLVSFSGNSGAPVIEKGGEGILSTFPSENYKYELTVINSNSIGYNNVGDSKLFIKDDSKFCFIDQGLKVDDLRVYDIMGKAVELEKSVGELCYSPKRNVNLLILTFKVNGIEKVEKLVLIGE